MMINFRCSVTPVWIFHDYIHTRFRKQNVRLSLFVLLESSLKSELHVCLAPDASLQKQSRTAKQGSHTCVVAWCTQDAWSYCRRIASSMAPFDSSVEKKKWSMPPGFNTKFVLKQNSIWFLWMWCCSMKFHSVAVRPQHTYVSARC